MTLFALELTEIAAVVRFDFPPFIKQHILKTIYFNRKKRQIIILFTRWLSSKMMVL
jgi:hypothetical protein